MVEALWHSSVPASVSLPACLYVCLSPQDFFETCAMLITVVIMGKYLECAAKGKTSEAIQVCVCVCKCLGECICL